MYPILGRYGPTIIYSFSVVLGCGIVAGIGLAAWQTRQIHMSNWFDGLLISLFAGLIGGRIGFVGTQWSYFLEQPSEVWQIWQGGLNYHGALLAGLLSLWGYAHWQKRPFMKFAGLFAPAFALVSSFGWFACWLEGCAYGRHALPGLLTANLPDSYHLYAFRYQTQLIGLGFSFFIFLCLLWLRPKWNSAPLFWFALSAISASRVLVSLIRGDDVLHLQHVRLDTLFDGALAFISLILLQYSKKSPLTYGYNNLSNTKS